MQIAKSSNCHFAHCSFTDQIHCHESTQLSHKKTQSFDRPICFAPNSKLFRKKIWNMVLQQLRHSIKKEQRFLAKSIELFKSKILNAFEKLNGAKSLNLKLLKQQMDQFAAKRLCPGYGSVCIQLGHRWVKSRGKTLGRALANAGKFAFQAHNNAKGKT